MRIGPILQRELITSVRRKTVFVDRLVGIVLDFVVVLVAAWVWDRCGWDRGSLAGVSKFALALFGLTLTVLGVVTVGLVIPQVSRAIASERDRKTLDALLTTRLSSAGMVGETMAAGLLPWVNGIATVVPVLVILVPFGGVDPRLILLAGLGLGSTAFALAAVSLVASVVARTSQHAVTIAYSLISFWVALPICVLVLKPRLWPTGPTWIVKIAVELLASNPFGLVANLIGLVRLGTPLQAVWRMIAWELIGGGLLVSWAIWQLRPQSRAHYDDETRLTMRRILRATKWRLPRPPCGDDPVLWNAIYSNRTASLLARGIGHLINIVWMGCLVAILAWFAVPAFRELAHRGYRAAPEAFTMPEVNPMARVMIEMILMSAGGPAPGQARLEFNLALKYFSAAFAVFYGCALCAGALESLRAERERDTWLGLLATPLTGWEITRAKMLGPFYRTRPALFMLLSFWTVGTLAGAIHPLGFVAAVVGIAVLGGFSAAIGAYTGLMVLDRNDKLGLTATIPMLLSLSGAAIMLPGRWSVIVAAPSPTFLSFVSLFTYEDVHAIIHGGVLPTYPRTGGYKTGLEGRWVLAFWILGTLIQAVGAAALMRAMVVGFDAAVGRPTRPPGSAAKPKRSILAGSRFMPRFFRSPRAIGGRKTE